MASDSVAQRSTGRAGNGRASLFFLLTAVSFATPLPLTAWTGVHQGAPLLFSAVLRLGAASVIDMIPWSQVMTISYPSSCAACRRCPVSSLSHPLKAALWTSCSGSSERSRWGVLWSRSILMVAPEW